MIECVAMPRSRRKETFVKPTRVSHPELFPNGHICETCPLYLLDRLNLEMGIVKIVSNDQIQTVLGIRDQGAVLKLMATMRKRRIMNGLKEYLMIERIQSTFPLADIVKETKKGSLKYRSIMDKVENLKIKPWITLDERFNISTRPGNDNYFSNMGSFTKKQISLC